MKVTIHISVLFILFFTYNSCKNSEDIMEEIDNKGENSSDSIRVSENYVPIDWNKTNIVAFDKSTGSIRLQFAETPPTIKNGSAFVLVVNDSVSSIRKVLDSSLQDFTYELQTEEGTICDIFTSGSFILSTDNTTSRTVKSPNVFYPVKIGYRNDMHKQTKGEIKSKLLNASIPLNQIKLWESPNKANKFTYESGSLDVGLDLLLEFNFDNKDQMIEKVSGNLMELKVSMVGSLDINYLISYTIASKIEIGEKEILKQKNIIKPKYLWFNVQGVPILIMVKSDLLADFQLSAKGKLNAKVGANYNITTMSGFEYNQKTNRVKNFTENTQSMNVIPPTILGEATVNFRPSVYPRFYVYFFGLVGPTIDIKPYIDFTAKAKYLQDFLVNHTPFASMEFITSVGLNLQSHLHYRPFDLKNDKDILMLDNDLLKFEIFRSPYKIVKTTNNVRTANLSDSKNEVTFIVYDTLAYSQKIQPTTMPLSVRVSSGNKTENKTIEEKGTITYNYDSSKPATIEATIYSIEGSPISSAKYEVDEREMLIAFYNSTNGDNWTRNDNWCSDKPISEWYGVKTYKGSYNNSVSNRVQSIELPNNNLTGSAHLNNLISLYELNILNGNNIESLTINNCGNEMPDDEINNYHHIFLHDHNYSPIHLKVLNISKSNGFVYVNGNFSAESVNISNCKLSAQEYIYFNLPSTIVGTLTVSNCTMGYFYADNSIIENIIIDNCTFLKDEQNNNAYIYVGNRTRVNNCKGLQYIYHKGPSADLVVTNTVCTEIHWGDDKE